MRRVGQVHRCTTRQNAGMHVSAKADYGMRALCELTTAYRVNPSKLIKGEQIATAQEIPIKFLEGILRQLRQAGIVASQAGTLADDGFVEKLQPLFGTRALGCLDADLAGFQRIQPEPDAESGE